MIRAWFYEWLRWRFPLPNLAALTKYGGAHYFETREPTLLQLMLGGCDGSGACRSWSPLGDAISIMAQTNEILSDMKWVEGVPPR